ncbi:MAG: methyltransferase [Methylibium sp.]|nr:methyltransferase [Methylibium sp.]
MILEKSARQETGPRIAPPAARDADDALLALGRALIGTGYRWVCPTPDTQALVNARPGNERAHDLRGVFGWSRPFNASDTAVLPAPLLALMREAGALEPVAGGGALWRSRVRFSSFSDTLLAHSAWPTTQADAVFFGPDTYRFTALIERVLAKHGRGSQTPRTAPCTVVDLGCGSGAGGIVAARLIGHELPARVLFTDINPEALRLAAVNAQLAGLEHCECRHSDVLAAVDEPVDLVLANPPYLIDAKERAYRHGGGRLGTGLALRIVDESLQRLAPGGRLILYTAAPVVAGVDLLWQALQPRLTEAAASRGAVYDYAEIDPDVFGAELAQPGYGDVERLAVAGLSVQVR